MRHLVDTAGRAALIAAAMLWVAGCNRADQATNAADANALDANQMVDQPANDADAMETAINAPEPVIGNGGDAGNGSETLGDTRGGDTGGNVIESNRM